MSTQTSLAQDLRELHSTFARYSDDGFTMTPEGMPEFLAMLDYFASRAEREAERTDLQGGLQRARSLLAEQSAAFDQAFRSHEDLLREAVQSGKVAMLRPSPAEIAEAIGSAT